MLDASGSVQMSNAVEDVRNSARSLLKSMVGTASTAGVTQFATFTEELAPRTQIVPSALDVDSPLGEAIAGYYNPKPPQRAIGPGRYAAVRGVVVGVDDRRPL